MNVQIKQWIWLLWVCCQCLVACSNDDAIRSVEYQMMLSENSVMFIQKPLIKEVTVTNGGDWTVIVPEEAAGWCSAERNGDVLVITVTENTEASVRETVLMVSGNEKKTLPVRQTGTSPIIRFVNYDLGMGYPIDFGEETPWIPISWNLTEMKVEVMSNISFEVVALANSWITVKSQSEIDENGRVIIEFSITPNEDDEHDRSIEIMFKQKNGDYSVLLPVKQRKNIGEAFELTETMFKVVPKEGALEISWTFPEGKIYDKVVFEYDNKKTPDEYDKLIKEIVFGETKVVIDDLYAKYGDMIFKIDVLNEDGTSLVYNEGGFIWNGGMCKPVPAVVTTTEKKVDLSIVSNDPNDADGLKWLSFSGQGKNDSGNFFEYKDLVDGDLNTVFQTESHVDNSYNYIIIQIPDEVECKEFTIKTVNAMNQISQAPGIYTVSIGESNNPDADDWEVVFEQKTKEWKYGNYFYGVDEIENVEHDFGGKPNNSEGNKYRYKTLPAMKAKQNNKAIKYIKYAVLDRNNDIPRKDYFKLAEFALYTIQVDVYDPENE